MKGRSISAEFLGLNGKDKVNLRMDTGKMVTVDLARLSKEDQDFIANHPASKLTPITLPEKPLFAVKDWDERLQRSEVYFIDATGKRAFRRAISRIHYDGYASCMGKYAVVEGPQLGVLDADGAAQFGVSRVGPPGLESGSDAPIFMGRYGTGDAAYVQYLRKDGKLFIKNKFANGRPFRSERAWVNLEAAHRPEGRSKGTWTLIDYRGSLLHAFQDLEVQDFSEGRAGVALDTNSTEWSIIDINAEVIAEGPFRKVGRFIDGAAVVDGRLMDKDGKWLMEERGGWVIEGRHANSESDAVVARRTARGTDGTRYGILKRSTGEFLADIPDELYVNDGFFDGLASVRNTKTHIYGFINRVGDLIIEPKFAAAKRFSNGFAEIGVKHAHDRAVINLAGEVIWEARVPAVDEPDEKKPDEKKPDPGAADDPKK